MVWMGKIRGHSEMRRVYGPDLMLEVCAWSEKNPCRHFFLGGAPGVAEALADKLKARFPKLEIAGTFTPPFRPLNAAEEKQFVETVRAPAGHFVGRLKHAQAGKIHGRISAEAGRDADDWRGRGV